MLSVLAIKYTSHQLAKRGAQSAPQEGAHHEGNRKSFVLRNVRHLHLAFQGNLEKLIAITNRATHSITTCNPL
jgi:hypothetical protein